MKIQKLNWAGIKIEVKGKTILIDAVENFAPYEVVMGLPRQELVAFSDTTAADYCLMTHLHFDHYDPKIIDKCLKQNGIIIASKRHQYEIEKINRPCIFLEDDEIYEWENLQFKAVYAQGGIGEKQISWIISDQNMKIFHGGDTIWHNQFWRIGMENGPFDIAFLPVNGVIVNLEKYGIQRSTVPASMLPEEAFNAAKLLKARNLVPIHHGLFQTENYQPADSSRSKLDFISFKLQQPYLIVEDGEYINPYKLE